MESSAGDESFSVDRASGSMAAREPTALEQVQRGDITVDQYLDARVEQAVHHLEGRLKAEELDFVKQTLREQLSEDPILVELVRRTTAGAAPAGAKG